VTVASGRGEAPRAWMSWSSGKDSTLALHTVRATGEVDVVGLLTTVNSTANRVAMHAVRRSLLEAQAHALGLPLHVVELPWPCPNEVYEEQMSAAIAVARTSGVAAMVFGDLFLEDIRRYREESLRGTGLTPLFPLWQRPSRHRGSWPAAGTTGRCWPTSRPVSTPVARTASSTPSSWTARASPDLWMSPWARPSNATASSLPTWFRSFQIRQVRSGQNRAGRQLRSELQVST